MTGLFGTNSSGKTSIIQFLLMLKQTKEAADRAISPELNGDHVRLGTFKDVVHRHDDKRSIEYELGWQEKLTLLDPESKRTAELVKSDRITIIAEIKAGQGAPRAKSLSYASGGATGRVPGGGVGAVGK